MRWLKQTILGIPLLGNGLRQAGFLAHYAYLRWFQDLRKRMDEGHRRGEWDYGAGPWKERSHRALVAMVNHIEGQHWGEALEVGCSAGAFTEELAKHAHSVTAIDFSPVACALASERLRSNPKVRVRQLDVVHDEIPGHYDLIFIMDVLEQIHGIERVRQVLLKLAKALRRDGVIVFTGSRLAEWAREHRLARKLGEGADRHFILLLETPSLEIAHYEKHPEENKIIPGYPEHTILLLEKTSDL